MYKSYLCFRAWFSITDFKSLPIARDARWIFDDSNHFKTHCCISAENNPPTFPRELTISSPPVKFFFLSVVLTFLRLPSQKCPIKLIRCTPAFYGKHLVSFISQLAPQPCQINQPCRVDWWWCLGSPEPLFHIQRKELDTGVVRLGETISPIPMASLLDFKNSPQARNRA